MRTRIGLTAVLVLVAATSGPPRQAAVALVVSPSDIDLLTVEFSEGIVTSAVVIANLGDGDAWVSDVHVEGDSAWALVEPWQPLALAVGEQLTISVQTSAARTLEEGLLVVTADGVSVPAVGCASGRDVASDTVEVRLFGGALVACDEDDDGFASVACGGQDCNDLDFDVSPGATEQCNDVDDNCNDAVDEAGADGEMALYADSDGDGFGDASQSILSCDPVVGFVADDADCDDTNVDVHPGAVERCITVLDDNCDGTINEAGADGETEFFADADEDGFGGAVSVGFACSPPPLSVGNALDCADTLPLVNPAQPERCNDIDDNCDGITDEDSAIDAVVSYVDADGDGFGSAVGVRQSCMVSDSAVLVSGDCDDLDFEVNPGATEQCNDVDDDCDGVYDEGFAVGNWYPDADGDGAGRRGVAPLQTCGMPAGMVMNDDDCVDSDASVVECECGVVGPNSLVGISGLFLDSYVDSQALLTGPADAFGAATAVADLDGDGCDEVVVSGGGQVWVFDGPVIGEHDTSEANAVIYGDESTFGDGLSAGDFNGDGLQDIVVAAPGESTVYVFHGPLLGDVFVDEAAAVFTSAEAGGLLGHSMAVGDLDSDGITDLVVGEPNDAEGEGSVWIVYGPVAGSHIVSVRADVAIQGEFSGDSVAIVGDISGDGVGDLVVGSVPEVFDVFGVTNQYGSVKVYTGPLTHDVVDADRAIRTWTASAFASGRPAGNAAGAAIVAVGDTNGDGRPDFAASAPESALTRHALFEHTDFGAMGVFYGSDQVSGIAPSQMLIGGEPGTEPGKVFAYAGDVNGDGLSDFLATGASNRGCWNSGGSVSVLLGSSDLGPDVPLAPFWSRAGLRYGDDYGSALAAGDTNADGFSDFTVSAIGLGETRVYWGAPEALPEPAIEWQGVALCLEGPVDGPSIPSSDGQSFSVSGTIIDLQNSEVPPAHSGGFSVCSSGWPMVAAFESDSGDIWTLYGSSELTNADLAIGSPFSASFSASLRQGGHSGVGRRSAFADSRGLLYGHTTVGWGGDPLHDLVDYRTACIRRDLDSSESQLVVNGQPIPLSGATYVDVQGGRAIVSGQSSQFGGMIPSSSSTLTIARVQ